MNFPEYKIRHSSQIRVRYADTDKMSVVYNGVYFTYFEVGRTELMRNCGLPYTKFEKAGYYLPLIETKAEFRAFAEYDDLLDINTVLTVRYEPIIRFDYNILRDKTTIAIGYTLHSFLFADSRKPARPPKIFFDAVSRSSIRSE